MKITLCTQSFFACALCLLTLPGKAQTPGDWQPLFNGKDLTGWTAKIRGHELGDDPYRTFRVEDGLLTVSYENYDAFDNRFGHLFYERPFESYELHVEYRFTGDQATGGAGWAFRNSGVMFHSQDPHSMGLDQDFPISIEAQLLGGNGTATRTTLNLCTPGTHVTMDGKLFEQHCVNSSSETYHGDGWVTVELIVRGHGKIEHVIEGRTVLEYSQPIVGGGMVNGHDPAGKQDGTRLTGGYISLQSESHPIQFRQVLIREL